MYRNVKIKKYMNKVGMVNTGTKLNKPLPYNPTKVLMSLKYKRQSQTSYIYIVNSIPHINFRRAHFSILNKPLPYKEIVYDSVSSKHLQS